MCHNYRVQEPISHCDEKPVHHTREEPLLAATRESPQTAMKTSTTKNKFEKKRRVRSASAASGEEAQAR